MRRRNARGKQGDGLSNDPEWYKDAVIYEVRVRSFFDSNDDGVGDFRGLASKLDYLADLGVTALWLLPFYKSPQRDDGYDIADYTEIQPELGTLEDFRFLLDEAHARGIRIITELVLNHTSDQHPWFQRARHAKLGSSERSFYVWSPTATTYQDARIIFKDFETSNWTWDPVANEYFWHRFYSHQPDLNFESQVVQDALLGVVDFWMKLGVDGLRLDAVPYLYEADGTNCENLPKTHAFLRKLRAHVDAHFPNRMLLAEANQWPEDAAAYFGAGDECHMNFHFPIMPRMFMAIHMEDSFPIVDILAQTPTPPASAQWALFLRNHDELTLEMVTDDERDYMYRAYATDSAARINLGIRRRLAPLVGNDRRKIELLNGLLFSLSGTPVLYYGDEIGMGDNIFLGDRNGVRTPMQWSMDRNAGFSRANSQRLILPVNTDSEYHYESLNVEAQQNNPSSLLWWTKRLIAVRADFQAFGRGTLEILTPSNSRVLAFVRRYGEETVLVVANLSRAVQYVEVDLSAQKGLRPVELFGGATFPPIGDAPYALTLGGHSFYWFSLERALGETEAPSRTSDAWVTLVGKAPATALAESVRSIEEALPAFFATRRWFRGLGREVQQARIIDSVSWPTTGAGLTCLMVHVDYAEGESETYPLWLAFVPEAGLRDGRAQPLTPLVRVLSAEGSPPSSSGQGGPGQESVGVFVDALDDPQSARVLFEGLAQGQGAAGQRGAIISTLLDADGIDVAELKSAPHAIPGVHANVPIQVDDRYLLKVFRRVNEGTSVDLEVSRALEEQGFGRAVKLKAVLEYKRAREEPITLAVLETFVANTGTAWHQALGELGRYYERVLIAHKAEAPPPNAPPLPTGVLPADVPANVRDLVGSFLETVTLLGRRTADLHRGLLTLEGPLLAPEPYSTLARRSEYQSFRNLGGTVLRELKGHVGRLSGRAAADAAFILERRGAVMRRFEPLLNEQGFELRLRSHGNFHLEQVLFTGKDFVILDFEGELDRSFNERRRKRSPLRDVACMLRSIENAALVALWEPGTVREVDRDLLSPWAGLWTSWVSSAYLAGYYEGAAGTQLVPPTPAHVRSLLDAFALERMLRDLRQELEWREPGIVIPLRALAHLVEADEPSPSKRVLT